MSEEQKRKHAMDEDENGHHAEKEVFIVTGLLSIAGILLWFLGVSEVSIAAIWVVTLIISIAAVRELVLEKRLTVELLMAIVGFILAYHSIVLEA
ncbi:hypothetical protein [Aeropyrum camini]|uniref:hypothetical protein n=1 Tax=Aeropyrum camini TaxID=229980 RepID=UPI0012E1416F|nr:hypothetical protein [Aeropyrum camini]